ncbi:MULTISPECIES: amidohydrolase family protein [Nocardia]|uniref:amidohydrolase family protein n=1 Tax=Nocardia TaxID=1817 RepID=UPI001893B0FE|nr:MULTISPECIES: amidohydrolase family protein [Nocardia]MBF6347896.1 amidohydrolase [Nocardia flavorosea]
MAAPQQALDPELFDPEPEPAAVRYTVISVDDHVVEPPHLFETWMPAALRDRGPRIRETADGAQVWEFEGKTYSQVGMNAVAGRRSESVKYEPFRFEQMRPGCYDIHARVRDMDLGGIWAMLNFPSQITGFCGRVFAFAADREVGKAAVRAWNDWIYNEWYLAYPSRVIPGGITYLGDPVEAVAEIERNAARGFTSVTLPERPHAIGLPSLWERDYWDPIIRACVETDTVISLHVGSSGMYAYPQGAPGLQLGATMFGQLSLGACSEWLWSGYPKDNPTLKIAMSEGGIGWVPMLIDRLDNIIDRSGYGLGWDERPADILRRNFWFCTLDDPSTIALREVIGVDHIMLETDYPHGDGTWPHTQDVIERYWAGIPAPELRKMCSENAARLYRHPLPDTVLPRD